jgi:hypothetical protein
MLDGGSLGTMIGLIIPSSMVESPTAKRVW